MQHRTALTLEDLRLLLENPDPVKVSIYMPTHRRGPETQQDSIRFKNLLAQAKEELQSRGMRDVDSFLKPAADLQGDPAFWNFMDTGLALFRSESMFMALKLPLEFVDLAAINDRFHLKQVFPYFRGSGHFYMLALSDNDVRLYRCTRYGSEEIEVDGMPKSMSEALWHDENEKTHTEVGPGRNVRADRRMVFFYSGGADANFTENTKTRFLKEVDRRLHEFLRDKRAPLLLAGVEEVLPVYKAANTYPYLLDAIVTGNPDRVDPENLRKRAWEIVEPIFTRKVQENRDRFAQFLGTGLASDRLEAVATAAYYGRVDALFVARGVRVWGRIDNDTQVMEIHGAYQPGDQDLLDYAAAWTLLKGGAVYALPPGEIPGGGQIAAVFRF
ncbi:hypothetical protein [Desulfocurvibacter africanus]|uniref:Uncharacterized protein n=1 Tax=Desulfocurvibacter africanus subsp. africanus str. Walvis Bay TaxID=690850 RepID=F3YTN2_DESAF|nr:hypothetical protein [Desulfocurvibacter africanus]EGJ49304.1 hypothetical protein Desaf_0956 [Desulfocurvibacter africanus subsp. africanus str. Walvis Bay]